MQLWSPYGPPKIIALCPNKIILKFGLAKLSQFENV